jgi:hypothetical protein
MTPRPRLPGIVMAVLAIAALAGCGSSASSTTTKAARTPLVASGCRASSAGDQTVTTATYVFLLHVGFPEKMRMLTAAQAKAKHITTGELMLGGSMAMPSGGMRAHMTTRHVEIHICTRASGKVVTNAMPSISAVPTSGGTAVHVPVMVMQGVTAGSPDLHYGNNVPLRLGTRYRITARLGGEQASFDYAVPRGM